MGHRFAEIAFTDTVRRIQEAQGSRRSYARFDGDAAINATLGPNEAGFIAARDSFYMASVGETGWPYVQHRGGPIGFVRVLDERTLGFADFRGNRQYVSVGNLTHDARVALIFMDYANQTRLKLLGRVKLVGLDDTQILSRLTSLDYRARVERGFVVDVAGYDWNCPQHITPRYTLPEIEAANAGLRQRIAELEAELGEGGAARA